MSNDRNEEGREPIRAKTHGEGATLQPSFEEINSDRTFSRRQAVGLAGAALAGATGLATLFPTKEAKAASGEYFNLVPGYVVRPERYGPEVFENVNGIGWSDQQGLSQGWGTTFRGKAGVENWFHFPITNPTIFNGQRLKCNQAAVTLELPSGQAYLKAFHLWDRVTKFFARDNLSVTGNYGNTWIQNRNAYSFPDHVVDGAIGISVLVRFSVLCNVKFTGAGLVFHT
jgi:hypothetical protein